MTCKSSGFVFLALLLGLSSSGIAAADQTMDKDRDGVADRVDLCPGSPAGAKIVALGCSALEIALTPQALVDAVSDPVGERRDFLARASSYAPAVEILDESSRNLALAAATLRRGEPCAAADLADQAVAGFEAARREISQTAADGALIYATSQPALSLAAQAAPLFRAACSEVAGRFTARGRVAEVHDAARTFRFEKGGFEKGNLIGLAEGFYRVGPVAGMEIQVSGVAFADGSRLATEVRGTAPREEMLKTQQCLNLAVAPFQLFPPFNPNDYHTVYALDAYTNDLGTVDLEKRQRFAARDMGCPGSPNQLTTVTYSMKIDVTQGANSWTIATNLKDGEVPVALPSGLLDNVTGQVAATVQKTTCPPLSPCTTTTLGTHTAAIFVRPTGTFATAIYDKTVFEINRNQALNDFRQARVTGLTLSVITEANNSPHFFALGYQSADPLHADVKAHAIYQGQAFAIYDYDHDQQADGSRFFDDTAVGLFGNNEFNRTGVDRASGLIWPEVTGERNGQTFSYSVKLPRVIRDRIIDCPGALDSFYRMPFPSTSIGLVKVTKGNSDDPGAAHSGTASFALDFSGPSAHTVYAARPGIVVWMNESSSSNASEPGSGALGNYILVSHQDLSYGLYYHLAQNSIPADIALGSRLRDFQAIGAFGGSKLHFEVGDECPPILCSGASYDSVKVLYDAWVNTWNTPNPAVWNSTHTTCYLPRTGNQF